jgi:hypothetical protein
MPPKKTLPIGRTPIEELRRKLVKKTLTSKECQRLLAAGANPNEEKASEISISILAVRQENPLVLDKLFPKLMNASQAFVEYIAGVKNFDENTIRRCDILLQNGADINALSKLEQVMWDGTVERRHLTLAGVFNQQKESIYASSGVAALEVLGQKLLYVLNRGCQMDPGDAREFLQGFSSFVTPLEDKHTALIDKLFQVGAALLIADSNADAQASVAFALTRAVSYENLSFLLQAAHAASQDDQAEAFEKAFAIRQSLREERRRAFEEEQKILALKREEVALRVAEAKRQMEEAEAKALSSKSQSQAQEIPIAQLTALPIKSEATLAKLEKKKIKSKTKRSVAAQDIKKADELQATPEQEEAERRAKEELARQAILAAEIEAEVKRQKALEAQKRQEAKVAREKLKKQIALEKRQAAKQKRKVNVTDTSSVPAVESSPVLPSPVSPTHLVLDQVRIESQSPPVATALGPQRKKMEALVQNFIALIKQFTIDSDVWQHAAANKELILALNALTEPSLQGIFDCANRHYASGAALNCYGISKLIQKLAQVLSFYDIAIALFEAALAEGEGVANAYVNCAILEAAVCCNRQKELSGLVSKIPQAILQEVMRYFSKFADEKFSQLNELLSARIKSLSVVKAMTAVSALYSRMPIVEQTEASYISLRL